MDTTKPVIKLDWARLLGFDQATPQASGQPASADVSNRRLSRLGAKVGGKPARLSVQRLRGLTKIGSKSARRTRS